jgi:hypothetical protein
VAATARPTRALRLHPPRMALRALPAPVSYFNSHLTPLRHCYSSIAHHEPCTLLLLESWTRGAREPYELVLHCSLFGSLHSC